jgi:VWFA-related protein
MNSFVITPSTDLAIYIFRHVGKAWEPDRFPCPDRSNHVKVQKSAKTAWCGAVVAGVVCFGAMVARTQDKDETVKFTVQTELVLIPTVVTDRSGKHVSGLKKEDFLVQEDGAQQKIATFEEITSSANRSKRADMPGEFSNAASGEGSARRVTLIVLDLINTNFADQASARQELVKYLTQSIDVREPTGLYLLTRSGIQVVHDFTTDPQILVDALHQVNGDAMQMVDTSDSTSSANTGSPSAKAPEAGGGHGHSSGASGKSSASDEAGKLQNFLNQADFNMKSFEQRMAITYTLEAMQQLAQSVAAFPGRKSLIWASGGFPFNVTGSMELAPAGRDGLADVLPLYERTWQLLNDSEISLYPVDVKGLKTPSGYNATRGGSGSARNPARNSISSGSMRQMDTQATFGTFATMTGGRAYYNSNDLVRGFRDAVDDSSQYYMIGYYLDQSKTKAGWRKVTVKLNHEHGDVRARSGFFVTNTTMNAETSRNNDMTSALQSSLDFTSLVLHVHWDKMAPGKDPGIKHVTYSMLVGPTSNVINESDNNHMVLDFAAIAITPDGKIAATPAGQKVDIHLTAERATLIKEKGVVYNGGLDLPPGEYQVRFAVRDDLNGRTGSVSGPLKVESSGS